MDASDVIGKYRLRGVLGRGGMGVVYDAVDDGDGRVAVKTVLGLKNKFVHAVRREIHALSRLRHPGIVRVVDEGTHEGAPWYAMEYVDGLTLRAHVRAHYAVAGAAAMRDAFVDAVCTALAPMTEVSEAPTVTHAGGLLEPIIAPGTSSASGTDAGGFVRPAGPPVRADALDDVLVLGRRLALALEYLHGAGLVHRDLKPDNVIVRPGDLPVIVDFGLVFQSTGIGGRESIDELALLGAGTASYMAPEQIRGDGVDARADLYSLGCILFELVSGRAPFVGPSTLAVLNQQLNSDPPSLRSLSPWVSEDVDDLVLALLRKKPHDRPANAAVVAARIAEIVLKPALDDDHGYVVSAPAPFLYRPALAGRDAVLAALDARVALLDRQPAQQQPQPSARAEPPSARADDDAAVTGVTDAVAVTRAERSRTNKSSVAVAEVDEGGMGGVVLLVGESGIGKTRIALEAARRAANSGALVLAGEAVARGARPLAPLRKVLQLVSERCTQGGLDTTTTLFSRQAPSLKMFAAYEPSLVVVPGFELFPDPEPLPAPEARRRLLESLRETLDTLARQQPLLVVIDDLQWADELTIAFLDHLAQTTAPPAPAASATRTSSSSPSSQAPRAPFLVIATVRSETGEDVVDALAERKGTTVLRLDRLDAAAVHAVVDGALGVSAPDALVRIVDERAGGVPFWVTEVLHGCVAAGVVERDARGIWQPRLDRAAALPKTHTELLGLRFSLLDKRERDIVDAAAVLGRGLSAAALVDVSARSEHEVLEAVTALRARQILDDDAEDGLRFSHDKLAEAAFALLDPDVKRTLHERAARSLATTANAETLAWHHENAGDMKRAAAGYVSAGDSARTLSALKDAERCYDRAIAILERADDVAGLAKTLMKRGLVHTALFDSTGAQRTYQRAFSLWAELKDATAADLGAGARRVPVVTPTARVRLTNQPKSLDPARAYDSDSLFVTAQMFEGLVELDVDGNAMPGAASSWDISADGRSYTFHLRSDARWSDGVPLTAADFELAWKRILDPRMRSPVAQLLTVLDNGHEYHEGSLKDPALVGVTASDEKTLEVRLASPSAYLLPLLSHPATFPIPAHVFFDAVENKRAWTSPSVMVSNGAFVLDEKEPLRVRLRRNPLFTGRAEGNVAELEINAYRNYRAAMQAYDDGHLDILDMITAEASVLAHARAHHADELRFFPLHSTQYLVLRSDRPPLDDERVRKALALLIDRDGLKDKLAGSSHLVARGGFIAQGVAGHTPELALRFDPERAAALLAAAGYASPSRLPPLSWLHTHGLGDATLRDLVAEHWRRAGVPVELEDVDWDDYEHALLNDPPHVTLGGWIADYPDPDTFLRAVFHSVDGAEKIGWSDPRFDALVDEAARTSDPRAREELYATADHMIVADRAVVVPLSYGQNPVLLRKTIRAFPAAGSYLRAMKNVIVDDGA